MKQKEIGPDALVMEFKNLCMSQRTAVVAYQCAGYVDHSKGCLVLASNLCALESHTPAEIQSSALEDAEAPQCHASLYLMEVSNDGKESMRYLKYMLSSKSTRRG